MLMCLCGCDAKSEQSDFALSSATETETEIEDEKDMDINFDTTAINDLYVNSTGINRVNFDEVPVYIWGNIEVVLTTTTANEVFTFNMDGTKRWGDGSSDTATTHTYATPGTYHVNCNGTSLEDAVFGNTNNTVSEINILKNITSINGFAFYNCSGLTNITISSDVTSIGNSAFRDCSNLSTVNWNAINCTLAGSVYNPIFERCTRLTTINIGNNVETIPSIAFYGCSGLTSITIPDSVTSIGDWAFSGCSSLQSITLPFVGNRAGVTSRDDYQYPFGYIFGERQYTGGTATTQYYCDSSTSSTSSTYYIPTSLKNIVITGGNILYGAFYGCSGLTSITIPDSVTRIGNYAFNGCSGLTSVTIPDNVTSIGNFAFRGCRSLTSVTIPENVTSIGDGAFGSCSGLTTVNWDAISIDSSHDAMSIPFYGCDNFTTVNFGNKVESIKGNDFEGCYSLTAVNITNINFWCNISFGVNDVNPLHYAKNLYLNGELVTNLVIPDSVTSIGDWAFSRCSSLTSVTIPENVTSIGDGAFRYCTGLQSITFNGTQSQWSAITKGSNWHGSVPATVVHCTDGDVNI